MLAPIASQGTVLVWDGILGRWVSFFGGLSFEVVFRGGKEILGRRVLRTFVLWWWPMYFAVSETRTRSARPPATVSLPLGARLVLLG